MRPYDWETDGDGRGPLGLRDWRDIALGAVAILVWLAVFIALVEASSP